jgi:hypothetical protein
VKIALLTGLLGLLFVSAAPRPPARVQVVARESSFAVSLLSVQAGRALV